MEEVIFSFDSVTYANKAKRLLMRVGITTKLTKIGAKAEGGGCLHGLSLTKEYYYSAVKALREAGINYSVLRN